jgi:hypothetical protein
VHSSFRRFASLVYRGGPPDGHESGCMPTRRASLAPRLPGPKNGHLAPAVRWLAEDLVFAIHHDDHGGSGCGFVVQRAVPQPSRRDPRRPMRRACRERTSRPGGGKPVRQSISSRLSRGIPPPRASTVTTRRRPSHLEARRCGLSRTRRRSTPSPPRRRPRPSRGPDPAASRAPLRRENSKSGLDQHSAVSKAATSPAIGPSIHGPAAATPMCALRPQLRWLPRARERHRRAMPTPAARRLRANTMKMNMITAKTQILAMSHSMESSSVTHRPRRDSRGVTSPTSSRSSTWLPMWVRESRSGIRRSGA